MLSAEFIELVLPNFLKEDLNLVLLVILHNFRNGLSVHGLLLSGALTSSGNFLVEEFSEIKTDWQVDKNLLVKSGVVVSLNCPDVLELWEVPEWVKSLHQVLERHFVLDSLNHVDDVVELVAVEHHV